VLDQNTGSIHFYHDDLFSRIGYTGAVVGTDHHFDKIATTNTHQPPQIYL